MYVPRATLWEKELWAIPYPASEMHEVLQWAKSMKGKSDHPGLAYLAGELHEYLDRTLRLCVSVNSKVPGDEVAKG